MNNMIEVDIVTFSNLINSFNFTVVPSCECQDLLNDYIDVSGTIIAQHETIGCGDIYYINNKFKEHIIAQA
ncbi:hypothetical protein [Paraglaciecola sp. 20A4]|uniref:hypothetical protein n=1 Tax=Paraglaciecola sp. 20A4 TaxID=2687288 RepID=UPI00140C061C|nr:hypothetical protein [Paraglaciecola sp. 20A4]